MGVILSAAVPDDAGETPWIAIGTDAPALDPARKAPDMEARLEDAFEGIRPVWERIGRTLAALPTGGIAHMPTCGAFGSDFGIMLAWDAIIRDLAAADARTLVVCPDPWLFRHLADIRGVEAGPPPPLRLTAFKRALRGFLARGRLALRLIGFRRALAATKRAIGEGDPVLLVYGHPGSDTDGNDAYFGPLMRLNLGLKRLLHTDAGPDAARRLGADGRTASLHAWGSAGFALGLPFKRWTPDATIEDGRYRWLIRRAAALENGGGGPAMNAWQQHCQRRFLSGTKPRAVAWPWENHGWERDFCRAAGGAGVTTIGYQHTVIGPHQFNYAATANHDGTRSLPDVIASDGPAYRDELAAWGAPKDRLRILGALRFTRPERSAYDPEGPVMVPLSAIRAVADVQIEAAKRFAAAGFRVLVKSHPMYPVPIPAGNGLEETDVMLAHQPSLRLVLYASGASGLDAVLAGVPAVRLLTPGRISIDVLPGFVAMPTATLETLDTVIAQPPGPPDAAWDAILSDPDFDGWRALLSGDKTQPSTPEEEKPTLG